MIGLKRHTVQVVDHDPGWASHGVEACRQVRRAGGSLVIDVQHVGSTAVPDLPAKPILDLVAGVTTFHAMPDLVERLAAIGFIFRGNGKEPGGHLFVRDSEPNIRTIRLHVVRHGDVHWSNYLRFRDLLRRNPIVRERYAELKRELARRFPDDRESYTDSKGEFIRGVLDAEAAGTD